MTPCRDANRMAARLLTGDANMMREGETPRERICDISRMDAQSKLVPRDANVERSPVSGLHLTAVGTIIRSRTI